MAKLPVILHIVGARPNFMKVAPVLEALAGYRIRQRLVHTGQHYDREMSAVFLEELGMSSPDHHLGIGPGSRVDQLSGIVAGLGRVIARERPDVVLVAGDVTSTLAGALAATTSDIAVAHVEAGLRSFDWAMPEEHNRRVVDHLSLLCLTHCADADENLRREAIAGDRVVRVGNTMIDSLFAHLPHARASAPHDALRLDEGGYVLVTLHRPTVVDDAALLQSVLDALDQLALTVPVVFPVHPRTRAQIDRLGWEPQRVRLLGPQSYLDFIALEAGAGAVLTDSGGIQEETTALGVPCFTFRDSTERPVTCSEGTNVLLGTDPAAITRVTVSGPATTHRAPEGWDGKAGSRAAAAIAEFVGAAAAQPVGVSSE